MANLTVPQILNLIEAPKNRGLIQSCGEQHERQRYHVEPVSKAGKLPVHAHTDFMAYVQGILPLDKFQLFKKFYRMPVPTVEITEKIHTELGRALEAENQYVKAEFKNPANATDFDDYRTAIGDDTFWQTEGMETVKTKINSVLIVDLPQTQLNPKPEPYYFLLEICPDKIWDVAFKKEGTAEYIIFKDGPYRLYAYDDSFYRIFEKPENAADWKVALEVRHSTFNEETGELIAGLGYCPARRFWDELMGSNTVEAKAPIAKVFGRLDEYIFDFVSLRYFAAFGAWPVMWEYENSEPKHPHPQIGNLVCQKGHFQIPQPNSIINGETVPVRPVVAVCEECLKGRYSGPGTLKRVSPPTSKDDANLANPMGFINPDVQVLKAAREALREYKREIIESATGNGGDVTNTNSQAKNKDQIKSGFEGKQSYLLRFKENFESAHKWAINTLCLLRYATDYLRSDVDKGDEFYLKSPEELTSEYTNAKKSGLPGYLLAPIRESISDTKYRNNPEQRMRQRILANLQPYPDLSDTELMAWATAFPATTNLQLLIIRLQFDYYVRRFEREQQMGVVEFARDIAFDAKINSIKESFLQYAKDESGDAPEPAKPIAPAPNVATPVSQATAK